MADNEMVKGFFMKTPSDRAPDFVLRKVGVNVDQFTEYLRENQNEKGYVNFDLLEARSGHWYLKKDEYVSRDQNQPAEQNQQPAPSGNSGGFTPPPPMGSVPFDDSDIPF